MYIARHLFFCFLSWIFFSSLSAGCALDKKCNSCEWSHMLYAGPEIYYVQRLREKGATQQGVIYAAKAGYERISPFSFYWGLDGLYGYGRLQGKGSDGSELKSTFKDAMLEARLGYTFQFHCFCPLFITPFAGGGYAWETSKFVDPSPLKIKSQIRYKYVCAGFLSGIILNCDWWAGINFKAKYTLDAKNKIKDPEVESLENSDMNVQSEMQYRVEFPLYYQGCKNYSIGLIPFYEYRHYGHKVNFPFDFLEMQLNIYGAMLRFVYHL